MEYYKGLTQSELIRLIASTQKSLYLCMPSIHKEVADAISNLARTNVSKDTRDGIHLLIDFDAPTFRQGYGDYPSIDSLLKASIEVKTLKDNRISFIISDESGYYLFIESRTLIPADKETINAVKIDPVSLVRLKKFFFSSSDNSDFEDELTNAIIKESKLLEESKALLSQNKAPVSEITAAEIEAVSKDIKGNPPLNFDFKRIVEFYSNKFQYVKLKFEGSNIQQRKIEIPARALPIADTSLRERLETRLNLFESDQINDSFESLNELKKAVAHIREEYLIKVKSREESLLNKLQKLTFENTIESLRQTMNVVKSGLLTTLGVQMAETKENLLHDLVEYYIDNPRTLLPDHPQYWEGHTDYLIQQAKKKSEEIINRIKWPEPHILVEGFKLEILYSDITYEDIKNPEFQKELKECGLINDTDENQLAEISKGVELRNS